MRFLFFDTETTGFGSKDHVVSLAAILTDEDGVEHGRLFDIIKPDGWTIPFAAEQIHGISTEIAAAQGKSAKEVMMCFKQLVELTDLLVGHNIQFDHRMARQEGERVAALFSDRPTFCTMTHMTNICKIKHPRRAGWKWPTMQEAYEWCFKKKFDKAHNALADVIACKDVFFHSCYKKEARPLKTTDEPNTALHTPSFIEKKFGEANQTVV